MNDCFPGAAAEMARLMFWGWLRLLLGTLQMALSVTAILLILQVGFETMTWAFIAASILATAVSRLLYRGKRDPDLGPPER